MSYLLKNGSLLVHSADRKTVNPIRGDLLITNDRIAGIYPVGSGAPGDVSATVIDCTGKIISPGFIDTHHHCYQTQLKGRHADQGLLGYMISGNLMSSQYTAEDVFVGQLGGVLESIDGGTTTVVDHSHCNYSPEHTKSALQATISSGIRSVFCYTPTFRVAKWDADTFELDEEVLAPWVMETYKSLSSEAPYANGRVNIGFAFDGWFAPKDLLQDLMKQVRQPKPKVITAHYAGTLWLASGPSQSLVERLDEYDLLGPDFVFSHANNHDEKTRKSDAEILKKHGGHTSSTPDTELQMGHGTPICFDEYHNDHASLGSDCHSNNSSDMLSAMRLALQSARSVSNESYIAKRKLPSKPLFNVVDAFNLATVKGAAAAGLSDEVGCLEVGKKADILIIDGTSPGLVCATEEDPVAAIVLHASVRDIETVFVDGIIRKEGGRLVPVEIGEGRSLGANKGKMDWKSIAEELGVSRKAINERIAKLNMDKAREAWTKALHIDDEALTVNG